MTRKDRPPRVPAPDAPQHWEGVADPSYLLAEISELRGIAQQAGMGTLAYLLEMAEIEARSQVRLKQERDRESDWPRP
jgi:hypothetical protein